MMGYRVTMVLLLCPYWMVAHAQVRSEIIEFSTPRGDTTTFHITKKSLFNENGLLITEINYANNTTRDLSYNDSLLVSVKEYVNGELNELEQHTYDQFHRPVLIEVFERGILMDKDTFMYDPQHLSIEETYEDGSASERSVHWINSRGNDTLELIYKRAGHGDWVKTCRSTSRWNKEGKIIEWKNTDCSGGRDPRETWEWDGRGRLLRNSTFTDSDDLYRDEIFTYTGSGYHAVSTGYDADGGEKQLKTRSWEYQPQYTTNCRTDIMGRPTEERMVDEKGQLVSLHLYSYDNTGRILREVYCNGDGTLNYAHRYEYK